MNLVFPSQPSLPLSEFSDQAVGIVECSLAFTPLQASSLTVTLAASLIPVFSLDVPEWTEAAPLSRAVLVGWKRLVFRNERVLGELVYSKAEDGGWSVLWRQGVRCVNLIKAINIAEARNEGVGMPWETSVLEVSGLYVEALWLRERGGDGEWFVPIPPVNRQLEAFGFYRALDFESQVAKIAGWRLQFSKTV